jgi:hypothetical protein
MSSKNCRFKQIMTKTGTVKNSCVIDKYAITNDPDCNYNYSTGKCVINRANVPVHKPIKRRSPAKHLVFQPAKALMPAYIAKPVSKGECRYKTNITSKGVIKNICVQDKNLSISDSKCKRSTYGRCVLAKPEPLKIPSFYKEYRPVQPVMAQPQKREYIKYAANKDLADRLRLLQMKPLIRNPQPKPQLNYSIPPPPPPYTQSMLARKSHNLI